MALITEAAHICLVIPPLLHGGRGIVGQLIEALGFLSELLLVVARVWPCPNGGSRCWGEKVPDRGHRAIVQVRRGRPDSIQRRGYVAFDGEIDRRLAILADPTRVEMLDEFHGEVARPNRIGPNLG